MSGCEPLIIKLTDIQLEITLMYFFPALTIAQLTFHNVNKIMPVFRMKADQIKMIKMSSCAQLCVCLSGVGL